MSRAATLPRVLPGFGLSLGFTLTYLSLIVLIPLSAVFLRTSGMTFALSGRRLPRRACWRLIA